MLVGRPRLHVVSEFLSRGGTIAFGAFLPGLRVFVTLLVLGRYGTSVTATYGIVLSVYGIATVFCAGFSVLVVTSLAGTVGEASSRRMPDDGVEKLTDVFRSLWASTSVLGFLSIGAGAATGALLPVDRPLYFSAYAAEIASFFVLPASQALSGLQQVIGREMRSLGASAANFGMATGSTVFVALVVESPVAAVTLIGITGAIADLVTVLIRFHSLGELRALVRRSVLAGCERFRRTIVKSLASVPRASSGGYDGLVLMASFSVVSQAALSAGPSTGATTVILISAVRSLVVPLKSFGVVGGRLVRTRASKALPATSIYWALTSSSFIIALPLALVLVSFPGAVASALGLSSGPDTEFVIRLLAVQVVCEPLSGLGSAMMKVLVNQAALLRELAVIMLGVASPVVAVLALAGWLTLPLVWLVLVGCRVIFAVFVLLRLHAWMRSLASTVRPDALR